MSAAQPQTELIGSLRNARVAFPMPPGDRTTLTYFAGNMSGEQLAEIARVAPNVRVVQGLSREQALARAGEAHGVDARFATPEFIAKATNLVWVQAMSAGVENLLRIEPLAARESIVVTNMRAVHGPAIADHSFAMLLTLTRNLREYGVNQSNSRWGRGHEGEKMRRPAVALKDRTMLVVGLGGIGEEIAERAHGFGMRVMGIRRSDAPSPSYVEKVGHGGDLMGMLPEADVVAICLPLTAETTGMFDAAAFQAMKPGAYLINIARGRIVDHGAMLAALESGRLAGACLDVTEPEPLPADSPLWKRADVIITPHVASDAELTDDRRRALMVENFRRFGAGEPLVNVVDMKAGY